MTINLRQWRREMLVALVQIFRTSTPVIEVPTMLEAIGYSSMDNQSKAIVDGLLAEEGI